MYNVTLQQIETFLIVAQCKNLSEAAKKMFITQPALSKTIQRFEESIEITLFLRSNHGVKLTREGEYLYSALSPLYGNIVKSINNAHNMQMSHRKILKIGCPSSYDSNEAFDKVKSFVKEYKSKYPDVLVIEDLYDFIELKQALVSSEADIIFSQTFAVEGMQGIACRNINKFDLYIAMSAKHRLASRKILPVDELKKEIFLRVSSGDTKRDRELTYKHYRELGFTPKAVEFLPNFVTLVRDIKQGKGMSLCGKFTFLYGGEDIKYFPVDLDLAYVTIAWRTDDLSIEAKNFLEIL